MTAEAKVEAVFREWAEGLVQEAFVQGFDAGQDYGHRETVRYGKSVRLLTGRQIRDNEAPFAPIVGHEMDVAPDFDALVEALREIAAGAVPDYGSDPDYRTRGEMGNIASVALAFLTDEEPTDD